MGIGNLSGDMNQQLTLLIQVFRWSLSSKIYSELHLIGNFYGTAKVLPIPDRFIETFMKSTIDLEHQIKYYHVIYHYM